MTICYGCTMCNKCGKLDRMPKIDPDRCCPGCGKAALDDTLKECPECGTLLPPVPPAPPGCKG